MYHNMQRVCIVRRHTTDAQAQIQILRYKPAGRDGCFRALRNPPPPNSWIVYDVDTYILYIHNSTWCGVFMYVSVASIGTYYAHYVSVYCRKEVLKFGRTETVGPPVSTPYAYYVLAISTLLCTLCTEE